MISSNLLQALLSPDGNIRNQAETAFNSLSLTDRIQGLLAACCSSSNDGTTNNCQMIAAVLLRRDILKLTDTDLLKQLVSPLLQAFHYHHQESSSCKVQIGHCLAEICACLSLLLQGGGGDINNNNDGDGDDVESVMKMILSSLESNLNDIASVKLLAQLADRAPMAFTKLAVPSLPTIFMQHQQQISTSSVDTVNAWTEVVVNAAIATTVKQIELIRSPTTNLDELVVDPNSSAAMLGTTCLQNIILPSLVRYGSSNSNDHNITKIQSSLQKLSEAAITCPSLLAATPALLETVTNVCLELAQQNNVEIRLASLEVLSSLLSVGDIKRRVLPPTVASTIATTALPIIAQLLVDGIDEDIQDWVLEPETLIDDDIGTTEDEEEFIFAESLMGSYLKHLGPTALNVVLPLVQQLFSSSPSSWRHCHAGLTILECSLEANPISVSKYMNDIVNFATSFAIEDSNNNIRVQYRAVRLLGIICETPIIPPSVGNNNDSSNNNKQIILERLVAALSNQCTKISATASLSLVSFIRGGGGGDGIHGDDNEEVVSIILQFLPDVMTALVRGPLSLIGSDTGSVTARVRAMGATACIAQAVGEAFGLYYNSIMPGLLSTAQQPIVELAGSAVEAATIIGQAVGKDTFQRDAMQLLSWILPSLQTNPLEQLLFACARIASVLEDEFAPYANDVMSILLQQAQQPPDVSILEGQEPSSAQPQDGNGGGDDSMTLPVPGRGMVKVTINTSKIQEKAQAARAVYELSKSMGAAFGPWAKSSFDAFLPLVSFPYSADVRSTAAQTLSAIYDASCAYGQRAGNMQLSQMYLPLLAESISNQLAVESPTDLEAMYALGDSLSEVFYNAYRYRSDHPEVMAKYSLTNAEASIDACLTAFRACLGRRNDLTRVLTGQLTGEDEKDEYNRLLEQEENLLTPLVDSMGYNLKFFGPDFLPLFERKIVPAVGPGLDSLTDIRYTISAMLLFDDCVEHMGPDAAARYAPHLLRGIQLAFTTVNKDLVQAAVYGVAQIARNAPNAISMDHCLPIVQKLLELTSQSKDVDNAYLIEISSSALASLTLFGPFADLKCVSRDTLIQSFVRQLPIEQDDDEAKICHAQFCSLVESGAIDLSSSAGNIARIIGTILADIEGGEDVATPDTCERLKTILFQMQQNLPASTMQQSFGLLDDNAQHAVGAALQEVARGRSQVVTP